jgi:hypothetical protein
MNFGHRVFVVNDDAVTPISQKAFNEFYLRHMNSFPQFANQTLNIAVVIYTLDMKKPKEIIRIDCQLMKVDENGGIDEEFERDGMRLVANRLDGLLAVKPAEDVSCGVVVNATRKFDERRHEHRHPKLSGPAHKRILEVLFK